MAEPRSGRRPGRPGPDGPSAPDEETVLERGLMAFAELGYNGASARELARRLGVSHNFIHDRFGSKAAFWRAAVDRVLERQDRERAAVMARHEGDDAALLRAVARHFYRAMVETPFLGRALTDEFHQESERLDHLYRSYIEPTLAAVSPSVDRLVAAGRMRPLPVELMYFTVIGPAAGSTQRPLVDRLSGRPERSLEERLADAERLADVVVDGLIAPPAVVSESSG